MELNDQHIEFIQQDIRNRGITIDSLVVNLVDHICCAIEAHPGSDFMAAYKEVVNAFGNEGFLKIQEETLLILTLKKEEKMKKTMYVIGFIATFLGSTGLLFKFLHWPGANMTLMVGILLFNFGFLPMYFYDKYKSASAMS